MKELQFHYFDGKFKPLEQFIAPDTIMERHPYQQVEGEDIALSVRIKVARPIYYGYGDTPPYNPEKDYKILNLKIGQTLIKYTYNDYIRYLIQPFVCVKDTEQSLKQ